MRKINKQFAALACLCASVASAGSPQAGWKWFTSGDGFSVNYPRNWYDLFGNTYLPGPKKSSSSTASNQFYIRTRRPDPELRGITLSLGQAEIQAWDLGSEREANRRTANIMRDDKDILRSEIALPKNSKHKCRKITEISSLDEVGPGDDEQGIPPAYTRDVHFFCTIGRRYFVTYLSYWNGDRRHSYFEGVALRIAESLTVQNVVGD